MLYGSDRLPQELVRLFTTPNKRHYLQKQPGRLPQERYDRLLRPKSGTITPTTWSPTPRTVRSTTSPREGHKHFNNSVAYPKSGTSNYFTQGAIQSAKKQLGHSLQEQYGRPLRPKSGTSSNYNSGAYPQNYSASRMT